MLNLKARPSITAYWFSERPPHARRDRAARSWLKLAALISILVHAALLTLMFWQPSFHLMPSQPEVVAQIDLVVGDGAQQTGAPPPSASAPANPATPAAQPSKPAPQGEDGAQPPSPPLQASQQAAPQQAAAPAAPNVNLGDGAAAPPAEIVNPIAHVDAAADPANTAPLYPPDAAARGEEGLVVVTLNVDAKGHVTHAELAQSSGSASLDRAAIAAMMRWHFRPAFQDGAAVPSVFRQAVSFHNRSQ